MNFSQKVGFNTWFFRRCRPAIAEKLFWQEATLGGLNLRFTPSSRRTAFSAAPRSACRLKVVATQVLKIKSSLYGSSLHCPRFGFNRLLSCPFSPQSCFSHSSVARKKKKKKSKPCSHFRTITNSQPSRFYLLAGKNQHSRLTRSPEDPAPLR